MDIDEFKKCINCKDYNYRFRKGYCSRCYPLILNIEKIEKGILPKILEEIESKYGPSKDIREEYVRQIKYRLKIIEESSILKLVSAHELEFRINETLRILNGKNLGKINDSLESHLKDDHSKSYMYQLFTKIQLLKPFKINYELLYNSIFKNKK